MGLPAGTTVLEKTTCSARTCVEGRPAQWERQIQYQGGCGCCEYNSTLVIPGECRTMQDGTEGCCCDGQMVRTIDTENNLETENNVDEQEKVALKGVRFR